MKNISFTLLLLLTITGYSQPLFEYEFDKNITIEVPEETEEGQIPNGKFIRSTTDGVVFTFSSSDKAKERLATIDDAGLTTLFQGVRDGNLKSTKGTLVFDEIITLQNIKTAHYRFTFLSEGADLMVESYVFTYKNLLYILQFRSTEKDATNHEAYRKRIIDGIRFK